jgi:hypothetical protein
MISVWASTKLRTDRLLATVGGDPRFCKFADLQYSTSVLHLQDHQRTKMSTRDPLLLLRRTLAAQQPPTLHSSPDSSSPALTKDSLSSATHLFFRSSQLALPLDTPTRFQRQPPEALTFNLREIFFAWLLQTESTAEYMSKCQARGIHHLTFLEKADLSTWLEGGDSSDYIGMPPPPLYSANLYS